jgi:hypothetical protein
MIHIMDTQNWGPGRKLNCSKLRDTLLNLNLNLFYENGMLIYANSIFTKKGEMRTSQPLPSLEGHIYFSSIMRKAGIASLLFTRSSRTDSQYTIQVYLSLLNRAANFMF